VNNLPTYEQFKAEEDSAFTVFFGDETGVEARLVEVSDLRRYGGRESYSLLFLVPPEAPIAQNVFRIEHVELGLFELFLVPIGRSERGIKYEAVFNRLLDAE